MGQVQLCRLGPTSTSLTSQWPTPKATRCKTRGCLPWHNLGSSPTRDPTGFLPARIRLGPDRFPPGPRPAREPPAAGQDRWGRGPQPPAQPAAPRLLASPKMTICHSIKVSGQLMGEPGSATPGQNGLLPGRGRSSNVKCRDIVPGPSSGPTPPMAARWTALG